MRAVVEGIAGYSRKKQGRQSMRFQPMEDVDVTTASLWLRRQVISLG